MDGFVRYDGAVWTTVALRNRDEDTTGFAADQDRERVPIGSARPPDCFTTSPRSEFRGRPGSGCRRIMIMLSAEIPRSRSRATRHVQIQRRGSGVRTPGSLVPVDKSSVAPFLRNAEEARSMDEAIAIRVGLDRVGTWRIHPWPLVRRFGLELFRAGSVCRRRCSPWYLNVRVAAPIGGAMAILLGISGFSTSRYLAKRREAARLREQLWRRSMRHEKPPRAPMRRSRTLRTCRMS